MPSGLLSRRQFLISMFAPAIANPAAQSPLPKAPKPEFWFGESVKFEWIDETSGKRHTEFGEVCGANWNQPENQWEYQVTWLHSTAYPSTEYPIFDGNLVTPDVLSKVKA